MLRSPIRQRCPSRRRCPSLALTAWGAGLFVFACLLPAQPVRAQELELSPCTVAPGDTDAHCGRLMVPEDPDRPSGRTIPIAVVVLPATGAEVHPDPVFFLHGGPGAAARYLIPLFVNDPLRDGRDFVFVDQRGTGASNGLDCRPEPLDDLLEVVLGFEMAGEVCPADRSDPTRYVTSIAMDDLDAVRTALGYADINLWGGSYGTRAALEYIRRHPSRVRTALLDGVAPAHMYIPLYFAPGAEAALGLALEDCRSDAACDERFPAVRAVLDGVLSELAARPARVRVTDPRTGLPEDIVLTRDYAAAAVLYALYNAGTAAQLPLWIHEADHGRFEPLASFAVAFSVGIAAQFSFGMTMAVSCPEDAARYDREQAEALGRGTFLGATLALNFLDACASWPAAEVDPAYWSPARSEVQALLFSGQADPVTPPQWAEQVLEHLPNGRHAVFPDLGHGATGTPCGRRLFGAFVAAGTAEGLDLGCAAQNRRPAFGGVEGR